MNRYTVCCKESVLEKKYLHYLNNKEIKVISFDIFDTLVFRDVSHPNVIFKQLGKKQYVRKIFEDASTFQKLRVEAESKARKENSQLEEITLSLIYDQLPLTSKQKKELIKREIELEYQSLYVNKQIEKWISLAIKYDKKVILISDMYLTPLQIEYVALSKIKNRKKISNVFVSNEYNATKATGNLYSKVLDSLHINNSELLHIGDNTHADYTMAKQRGITSLYYGIKEYVKESFRLETNCIKNQNKYLNYRVQTSLLNPYTSAKEEFFFNLGATLLGPVLWEFSHWVNSLASKNNTKQVNCVMREGSIFQKYLSKINKDLDINLVYASRKSTYLASINTEDIKKEGFDIFTHRELSVKNLFELYGVKIKHEELKKVENVLLKELNNLLEDGQSLFDLVVLELQKSIKTIEKNIKLQKKYLKKYLKALNYTKNSILIDFGGTGTILKNITSTFKENQKQKMNVLFYMHDAGFKKMMDENIVSFLPYNEKNNRDIEILRRSHEFIEVLFNGLNQTTLSYEKRENTIQPILDELNSSLSLNKRSLKAFDRGIDSFFTIAKKYQLNSKQFKREKLLSMIGRLIDVPTFEEAKYIGTLAYDEAYKSKDIETIITSKHQKNIRAYGIEKAYENSSSSLAFKIGEIPWVQGVLTQLDANYIPKIRSLNTQGVNTSAINKILEKLDKYTQIKEVYIYGVGQFFIELIPFLKERNIKIKGLIDTKAKFLEFEVDGYSVKSIENINLNDNDCIIISSAVFAMEINNMIRKESSKELILIHCL